MKVRLFLSLVLLILPIVATAQQPYPEPGITSVQPNNGPAEGGTRVTLTGDNLTVPPNFACALPCPTKVFFGGRMARLEFESDERLVVLTPPSVPGTVTVSVETGDGRRVSAGESLAFTYSGEAAQSTAYLLPIYLDAPASGANNSRWASDFWIRNNGTTPVSVAPWPCESEACLAVFPPHRTLVANEAIHNLVPSKSADGNPSRLVHFIGDASAISMSLRVADASRSGANAGTEIPVVAESEFRGKTIHLPNVPLDPSFRITVRVYDLAHTESRFRVRAFLLKDGIDVAAPAAVADVIARSTESGAYRSKAAYAETNALNEIVFAPPIAYPARLRVEIEPLTEGSRFWAFASVTNNDTQLITLVTPQ